MPIKPTPNRGGSTGAHQTRYARCRNDTSIAAKLTFRKNTQFIMDINDIIISQYLDQYFYYNTFIIKYAIYVKYCNYLIFLLYSIYSLYSLYSSYIPYIPYIPLIFLQFSLIFCMHI